MIPTSEIWKKGESDRAVYYGCGKTVTVTLAPSTNGQRAVCLTCTATGRVSDCIHTRAVRQFVGLPAREVSHAS